MTQRTYRTAQGKMVDLGALQLKNENVRAVGNMSVNARGDLLNSNNQPIDSHNQQVARQYQKQVTNVNDDVVLTSKRQVKSTPPETPDPTLVDDNQSGLAAAIARARQVKQDSAQPTNNTPEGQ